MSVHELKQFERLYEGQSLTSPSGRFVLHYDAEGVAVVTDRSSGEVRWRAGEEGRPAVGRLVLGGDGAIVVETPDDHEVVWRSGIAAEGAHAFVLTDEGDFDLLDGQRVRALNSRTGPVASVSLGEAAPVAEITGDRYLMMEGKLGRRIAVRNPDGSLQVSERVPHHGRSYSLIRAVVDWLERQPGTVLTWKVLPLEDRTTLALCLVDAGGRVLWREDMSHLRVVPPPARPHAYGGPELGAGGRLRHQSLTSISGAYTLVHQDDGNLVLYRNADHRAVWTTDSWPAGDGWADLTEDGDLVVRNRCGAAVWRSDTAGSGARWLVVDDDGGVALLDEAGAAVWEVRTGPHGPAPALNPARGSVLRRGETLQRQSLTSEDGTTVLVRRDDGRLVLFGEDGSVLWNAHFPESERGHLALGDDGVLRLHAEDGSAVRELGGPGDELVVEPGSVVLRRADGTVVWRDGEPAEAADEQDEDYTSWLDELGDMSYSVTVVLDVDPDEALRRLGADPSQIITGTWSDVAERIDLEDIEPGQAVAAYALGGHTLLVEDNEMCRAGDTPEVSRGTFAVTDFQSITGFNRFVVRRDGEEVDELGENGSGEVNAPEVRRALEEMGAEDPCDAASDEDAELLCRVTGVRPTVALVTGPARLAFLGKDC